MGEEIPPTPPSGDCPECLDDFPPLWGRLTLPRAPLVFEGSIPKLYCDGRWVYMGGYWCVGEDNHVSLMAWGGVLGDAQYACGCPGVGCWPFCSCYDYEGDEIVAILEVTGEWPPC